MIQPSRIYRICNAYESGYGHGATQDEMPSPYPEISDPELDEAYRIGYEAGEQMAQITRAYGPGEALAAEKVE